jgi:hypothetical protein
VSRGRAIGSKWRNAFFLKTQRAEEDSVREQASSKLRMARCDYLGSVFAAGFFEVM